MGRIATISAELTAGHPDQGAYSLTDSVATEQMNGTGAYTSWLRSADGSVADMVRYLATVDNRTNEGGDTGATLILGRLKIVADAEPYTDPFRRSNVWQSGGGVNEEIELAASGNTITFGSTHDISALNDKDAIILFGSTADDGLHQIDSISLQVVTVTSITLTETLERTGFVYRVQDSKVLTREQIQNAKAIFHMMVTLGSGNESIRFDDTEIGLAFADMETAGVWKAADTTALENFSVGQQSRGVEIGVGLVREGDVAQARA